MTAARRRSGDPEDADFTPARGTRAAVAPPSEVSDELRDFAEELKATVLSSFPRPEKKISLQAWLTGAVAAGLITLLAYYAGRDRKNIDESFAASQADRAAIHLTLSSHETQIQLMKQQIEIMQKSQEKLVVSNEEQSKKLDQLLREVKILK